MKRKVLAGNWKLYKTRAETRAFFEAVGAACASPNVRKIVAPSPTLLETALDAAKHSGSGIEVFAQNCAWAESGAFTGETSARQLIDLGVKGTLIAHSERRQYFGETDETAADRAVAALKAGLHVIYCIGERIDERKAGQTRAVLERQLAPFKARVLPGAPAALVHEGGLMLAYEPVWAIGTGLTATPDQAAEAHMWITEILGAETAAALPLLYGGSVKPDNFGGLAARPHVDGGLVGGASLEPASFVALHTALTTV